MKKAYKSIETEIHSESPNMTPSKGIFWIINDKLYAIPFRKNEFMFGLAKSGDTYVHKKLWLKIRPKKCNKPYNYYPRGRIEINSKGNPIMYANPNVDKSFLAENMIYFGLTESPKIIYDNSFHYKCYLDDGWKGDG